MVDSHQPRVVVGIDGSEASLAALRWALHEGASQGWPVEVVHCWQPQTLTDFAFSSPSSLHLASQCMLDNEVAAALAEMPAQPEVRKLSLPGGPPTVLLKCAEGASLLVLGAHGHAELRDLVLRKVTTVCLRHATCPVVVVDLDHHAVRHEESKHAAVAL